MMVPGQNFAVLFVQGRVSPRALWGLPAIDSPSALLETGRLTASVVESGKICPRLGVPPQPS
jgi:hypothetical protein